MALPHLELEESAHSQAMQARRDSCPPGTGSWGAAGLRVAGSRAWEIGGQGKD